MKVLAPAKVNLILEVGPKRPDGYHEIQTLMRRIDLCDEIEIDRGEGEPVLEADGEETPAGPENLVFRAARIFLEKTGSAGGARIRLRKRIPVAAGLGGGSSDAAAVLTGLNALFGTGIADPLLMAWGAEIGADVPFFIFREPAWACGKGEKLEGAKLPGEMGFLLLVPPFRISTAWAYAAYDRMGAGPRGAFSIRRDFRGIGELAPLLQNDLERASAARFPEIREMKNRLRDRGAAGALMSGSGPVLFGLFEDLPAARRTAEGFPLPAGWRAVPARGI